ncbi:hypothetical protein Bca101_011661 [Brassica carinata]
MDSRGTASSFDSRSNEDSAVESQLQEEDKDDAMNSDKLIAPSLVSSETHVPTDCAGNHTSIEAVVTTSESLSPVLGGSPTPSSKLQGAWAKPLFIAVYLVSNQFASLASLEGEEDGQLDMDDCTDSIDLMTPSGKRILREIPVKPTAKAKELQMQSTIRGRGSRGRGNRGKHLHYPSF